MHAHKMQTLSILIALFPFERENKDALFAVNTCFLCIIHPLQPNPLLLKNIEFQQIHFKLKTNTF